MSVLTIPATPATIESSRHVSRITSGTIYKTALISLLTVLVLFVHGYHPYSQDASIYIAGVEKQIDPTLFTVDAPFVESHARLSIFSHVLGSLSRLLLLPLSILLLVAYLTSIVLFLVACLRLAKRLFHSRWEQGGAVLLASACFTIPVAGTSLLLMDPYVTARSFSTPLSIFALASCLDHAWGKTAIWTAVVMSLHPLMGLYLVCFLTVLAAIELRKELLAVRLCVIGFVSFGIISLISRFEPITPAYREVIKTHGYLFLLQWHWYEVAGLIVPVVLMGIVASRCGLDSALGRLAATSMLVGMTAYLSCLGFVHMGHPNILARVQLLRSFHIIYCIGVVMMGSFIVRYFWSRGIWIGAACFAVALLGMFAADRQSYLESARLEISMASVTNPWEQAFLWVRTHTPRNAVFAAAPTLLTVQDEDAQGFRAIAERSILNGVKDEGVASIFPELAPAWLRYRNAAEGLNQMPDQERLAHLRPYGVTWVLLAAKAPTHLYCPYRNSVVIVCRLTDSRVSPTPPEEDTK